MKIVYISFLSVCVGILFTYCHSPQKEIINKTIKPNIIYILADDLGYGELGCYGQTIIETPHIDALAANGMTFTQHYSGAPVCAPARCILLTGQHAGHAYVRGNHEWKERGDVWDYQAMLDNPKLEGQWPIPDSIYTLGEMLQDIGYKTGMVGKWGLGAPETEGVPNKQGFDFFYGYNCQRIAHTLYPTHLWKNEQRDMLNNKVVPPHTTFTEGADINDPKSYEDFSLEDYAPTKMHDEAISFLKEQSDEPFFLYYASPIPHVPLQAPQKWVDHYKKKLGKEEPYTDGNYFPNQTPRATYAAMISYLDEQVGDLVKTLKEIGQYENTIIMFSSDNGPTYAGGADTEYFKSAAPFETYGPKIKGSTHEGGIRVPMIASWPGHIEAGSSTDHQSAFYDVMVTVAELSDTSFEQTDGISFLPTLLNGDQEKHEFLYWEFPAYGGQQAVRMGQWKGIRKDILKEQNTKIELYNLLDDLQEKNNVADNNPNIVQKIERIMEREHESSAIERFRMEAIGDD